MLWKIPVHRHASVHYQGHVRCTHFTLVAGAQFVSQGYTVRKWFSNSEVTNVSDYNSTGVLRRHMQCFCLQAYDVVTNTC
jgi:hypothetical protein